MKSLVFIFSLATIVACGDKEEDTAVDTAADTSEEETD
jgi:predicted small lipoprotein YifL